MSPRDPVAEVEARAVVLYRCPHGARWHDESACAEEVAFTALPAADFAALVSMAREREALKAEAARTGHILGRLGRLANRAYSDVSDNGPAEEHMKLLESAYDMWRGSAKGFVLAVADGDKERDAMRARVASAEGALTFYAKECAGLRDSGETLGRDVDSRDHEWFDRFDAIVEDGGDKANSHFAAYPPPGAAGAAGGPK